MSSGETVFFQSNCGILRTISGEFGLFLARFCGKMEKNIEAQMLGESSSFSQQKQQILAWTHDYSVSIMISWLFRDKHLSKDLMLAWVGIGNRTRGGKITCIWRTSRTPTPDPMDLHAQIAKILKLTALKNVKFSVLMFLLGCVWFFWGKGNFGALCDKSTTKCSAQRKFLPTVIVYCSTLTKS